MERNDKIYSVTMRWTDPVVIGHIIEESYKGLDLNDLKKALCEYLDLFRKNGESDPAKPDPDFIMENLGKYTLDGEFIQNEIDRMIGAYDFYVKLMETVNGQDVEFPVMMKNGDNFITIGLM